MRQHRGVQILVFGILSLVVCPIFGPVSWSMGDTDLQEMASGRMDATGRDMTQAGRICGIVGTVLLVIQIIFIVIFGIAIATSRP
jgi:hypothetical protein